jgi:hypothetical protein
MKRPFGARLILWFKKKSGIGDGEIMPWWLIIIYCLLNPKWWVTSILGPAVMKVKVDYMTGNLVIDGVPYSLMFLAQMRHYHEKSGGKAFMYMVYSPDARPDCLTVVEYIPEGRGEWKTMRVSG